MASADDEPVNNVPNPNIEVTPSAEDLPVHIADRTPPDLLRIPPGDDRESSGDEDSHAANGRSGLRLKPSSHPTHFYYSFPNSPSQSQRRLAPGRFTPTDPSESDVSSEDELPSVDPAARRRHIGTTEPTSTRLQSFFRRLRYRICRIWWAVKVFMTVPLWAALASLFVACIQPLQHALEYHMQAVKGALNAAGNCSIPLTLVVLGAYFYEPPRNPAVRADGPVNGIATRNSSSSLILNVKRLLNGGATRAGASGRPGETKTVVVAVLSRMVITPLLLLPLITLLTVLNVQPVFDE